MHVNWDGNEVIYCNCVTEFTMPGLFGYFDSENE